MKSLRERLLDAAKERENENHHSLAALLREAAGVSDKDAFIAMLENAHPNTSYEVVDRATYMTEYSDAFYYVPETNAAIIVRVMPGYRAHFRATFDDRGNMLSAGQWESM